MRRPRGWVGIIVLLFALVIVAMLAQTMLKQYGLLPGTATATLKSSKPGDLPRGPGVGIAPLDPSEVTPAPGNAIERARGLEDAVRQQAIDLGKRIDDGSK